MGLREWIIPQEHVFFELLSAQSQKVDEASKLLEELVGDFSSIKEKTAKIKKVEHEGDKIVQALYLRLNQTLVTPLDHEDIARLSSLYDDVLDNIFATAIRMEIYEIKKPTPAMKEFSRIIRSQVKEINKAMAGIKELRKEEMEKSCVEIHRLENEADDLLYMEISRLFKLKDAVEIIKYKEIYEHMERVTDKCDDVSNIILNIRMKYS
jgi:hypothetical protein